MLLALADCAIRPGIGKAKEWELDALRLAVANALDSKNDQTIVDAKNELLSFYKSMSEVKTMTRTTTPEEALESDVERLEKAVKEYDPNYKHPNYWRQQ